MLRKITWRFWAVIVLVLAVYGVLGYFFASDNRVDADIYTWGLVAAAAMPLAFAGVTWIVTRGHWKENDLGTNMVLVQLGNVPFAGILAWVFLFKHGILTATNEAWIEIGSPWWNAIWLGVLNWRYLRIRREAAAAAQARSSVHALEADAIIGDKSAGQSPKDVVSQTDSDDHHL